MENFVVSARKYRPATFDTVIGQQHITTTLKNAILTNQLAQVFLFCGPRGVGKTTCARILAKTINCRNLTAEGEACDVCESCVSFNRNASFNVHELDAASNNSVDDVRNLVEQVRYAPQTGKYKIYIIDEVHMLSNAAFNAFLKTLEEPPSYAIFILATTEKHKIIPTILSRCQIFDFNRIRIADIAGHLKQIADKEHVTAEAEALNLIARKADGGLRDALSMFDMLVTFSKDRTLSYKNAVDNLHILDYDYYFRLTDALLGENVGQAWLIFDEILKKGFDGHNFIIGLTEHFRNLLVCKDVQTVKLLEVSEQIQQKYTQQSRQTTVSFLASAMNLGGQCDLNYKQSKSQKMLVELTLLKMAHLNSAIRLVQLNDSEEVAKKKSSVNGLGAGGLEQGAIGNGQLAKNNEHKVKDNEQVIESQGLNNLQSNNPTIPQSNNSTAYKSNFQKPTMKLVSDVSVLEEEISKKPEKQVVQNENIVSEPIENEFFTTENLQKYWSEYALRLEAENRINDLSILQKPFVLEGTVIKVTVESETLLAKFNQGLKAELSDYLRQQLRNYNIQIRAEVIEIEEVKKTIYTVEQKFRYLLEKHPELRELKNALNLEI